MTLSHDASSTLELGERAPAFGELSGADGRVWSMSSFDDMDYLALVFSGNACPTAKGWEEELARLQEDYQADGLQLVLLNSNNPYLSPLDTHAEMGRRWRAACMPFPWLKDADGSTARAYGVVCTPQVFLLDSNRRLRYQGRIADSRQPQTAKRHDLREAVEDLVRGRPVRVPETTPFGCAIVW